MKALVYLVLILTGGIYAKPFAIESEDDTSLLCETFTYEESLQYTFFYQTVTWEEALVICQYYKAQLATVDDISKATFLANAIADSNIVFEDIWIGGRCRKGIWWWHVTNEIIPPKVDEYGFPPWVRSPNRRNKECMSMDRRGHDSPLFLDIDCRQKRPFICEKGISVTSDKPLPSKWVKIEDRVFVLYHGRISWVDAMAFCWQQGLRLAVVSSNEIIRQLAEAMTHTRPDFENVWIGATNQFGSWAWASNGHELPRIPDSSGYPPWRGKSDLPLRHKQCLVLDRHMCENATFIETSCDRTRNFVCEEYSSKDVVVEGDEIKFEHNGRKMTIIIHDLSWWDAWRTCESRGSHLVTLDSKECVHSIINAMTDNPRELKHVWLGGKVKDKTWFWQATGHQIPNKTAEGFPPWCDTEIELKTECLNLDRRQHTEPMMYGLPCYSKQPFVCEIDCSSPGHVTDGVWKCDKSDPAGENACSMTCNQGVARMGSSKMTCDPVKGWTGEDKTSMLPRCLHMCDVNFEILKLISRYDQTTGFLFVLDGEGDEFIPAALQFVTGLIRTFPLSNARHAGLISSNSGSGVILQYDQEDSCEMIQKISNLSIKHEARSIGFEATVKLVSTQIASLNLGVKSFILLITSVDNNNNHNAALLDPLKKEGHAVVVLEVGVAPRYDVTPLASVGPLLRRNLFTFDHPLNLTEASIFMTGDNYDNLDDCSAPHLMPGVNIEDLELPRWLIFRVTDMTLKELKAKKRKKNKNKKMNG